MPRTCEQRYAEIAYRCVQGVEQNNLEEYKARADSFPTFVMQAGLAQAVGFLMAKGHVNDRTMDQKKDNEYRKYVNDLAKVLGKPTASDFYEEVIAADLPQYRLLTRQALAAAGWLKRMAQARKADRSETKGAGS